MDISRVYTNKQMVEHEQHINLELLVDYRLLPAVPIVIVVAALRAVLRKSELVTYKGKV